jgi:hypothetical protein
VKGVRRFQGWLPQEDGAGYGTYGAHETYGRPLPNCKPLPPYPETVNSEQRAPNPEPQTPNAIRFLTYRAVDR